jgi:hypothetical protein
MQTESLFRVGRSGLFLLGSIVAGSNLPAQTSFEAKQVRTADLDHEIRDFLRSEINAHVAEIK